MKKKSCIVLLLSIVVFGCSSDSGEQTPTDDNDPPVQGETDTTAPVISLSGLEDTLEVLTTLNFSVTDASENVTTTVSIDGEDVFSSMEKQFSYELDPFDFTTGEKTITIASTDDSGNMGTASRNFELRKLLYRSSDLRGENPSNDIADRFIAVNIEETGELIAYKKIEAIDDGFFYAPEDFERQQIVVTEYFLGKDIFANLNVATSFADLQPGIEILTVEEAESTLNLNRGLLPRDGEFRLNLTDVPVNTPITINTSLNYGANGGVSIGLDFMYNIDNTDNIFIYSFPCCELSTIADDYSYFIIEDFIDQTISYTDFNTTSESDINTVILPSSTESFFFELRGYLDDDHYRSDNYRELFRSGNVQNGNTNSLDFPLIDFYGVYQQRLTATLTDGREIFSTFRGLSELQIPDLSIERNGNMVNLAGDYDYLTFIQDIEGSVIPGFSEPPIFRRFYNKDDSNIASIPFQNLEVPEEVLSDLTIKGYNLDNNSVPNNLAISLTKREIEIDYQDRIFYFTNRNEAGDITRVTFPLNP